jgi:putative peptide zinc metalloprotease protein
MKKLIPGIEIIGKAQNSGYKNPLYLIRTSDGKYIQLTRLLFNTVSALQTEKNLKGVATKITRIEKKLVDKNAVSYLIKEKLEPLGIIQQNSDTHLQKVRTPDMLLGLRFPFTIFSEKTVNAIAGLFRPLFDVPLFFALCYAACILNVWLYFYHGLLQAIHQTLYSPVLILFLIVLELLGGLFHEIGHAAGCLYAKGKPGKIGMGLYLIWPAFYTDLTDVYRFDRINKLRSDIGGIYFNIVFTLVLGVCYFYTHFEPLLILITLQNIDILHQLLPFVRLDGYYIISDFVGLPDLYARMQPILISLLPGKKHESIQELKPWVQWIVSFWVFLTIPILAFFIILTFINAPQIITDTLHSVLLQSAGIIKSIAANNIPAILVQSFQLILLFIPPLGVLTMLFIISKTAITALLNLTGNLLPKKLPLSASPIRTP